MRLIAAAALLLGLCSGVSLSAEPGSMPGNGASPRPAEAAGPAGGGAGPAGGGPAAAAPAGSPASLDIKGIKFGKSESDLLKTFRGLVCADARANIWGQADRSCFVAGEVMPQVRGTLVFNLRSDRFVSVALVVGKLEVDHFLHELIKRHGRPSVAVPSMDDPQKVIWLYENRVLILERSLDDLPNMSSLLVSADKPIVERARSLVGRLGGHVPPYRSLSSQ